MHGLGKRSNLVECFDRLEEQQKSRGQANLFLGFLLEVYEEDDAPGKEGGPEQRELGCAGHFGRVVVGTRDKESLLDPAS